MRFAVCSLYDQNYSDLAKITIDTNGKEYCDKWQYDHIVRTDNFRCSHLGFDKINLLLETLDSNQYDWVFWRGADTLITNFKISLNDLIDDTYELILTNDVHGLQSDSMLFKNTDNCKKFLWDVWNRRSIDPEEQMSMRDLLTRSDILIHYIPQKFMNTYDYSLYLSDQPWNVYGYHSECAPQKDSFGFSGQWLPGDFMMHWPGIRNDKRIELANYYMTQIVR